MNALAIEFETPMHSSRTMNHMDPETKSVHLRLEEWAKWAKGAEVRAWPSMTLLGRVIEQGASGAGQSGRPPTHMPDRVAVVDAAVARSCEIDKCALRIYYQRSLEDGASAADLARRMPGRMKVRQFQNVLRRARWRIAVRIGEI